MEAPDFEKLAADFYPSLYRFGFALTRNAADAADLTQQTFISGRRKAINCEMVPR